MYFLKIVVSFTETRKGQLGWEVPFVKKGSHLIKTDKDLVAYLLYYVIHNKHIPIKVHGIIKTPNRYDGVIDVK